MTYSYFTNPLTLIVETILFLYMVIIALRLLMQLASWKDHHHIDQFIIKLTQPPLKFLRQFLPSMGRWDTAILALLIVTGVLKIFIIGLLTQALPSGFMWLNLIIAELFSLFITIFTVSIIIEILLSWVRPPGSYNPAAALVHKINVPLLEPVRRLIPPITNIDLSPLLVILGLQVLSMLVMPLLIGHT